MQAAANCATTQKCAQRCRLLNLMFHVAFAGLAAAHQSSTGTDLLQQMRAVDAWVSKPNAAHIAQAALPALTQAARLCEETQMCRLRAALQIANAQHVELQDLGQTLSTTYDEERSSVRASFPAAEACRLQFKMLVGSVGHQAFDGATT